LPLEQLSVIALAYAPFCGVTVTVCVEEPPEATVASAGDTASAKSVTTICRSVSGPKPVPLLLALTVTEFVPVGHVILAPGDVPHPPVQLSVVSAHEFGSTNPSCAGVRSAPNVVFASKVIVGTRPVHVGSTVRTDWNASARPAPNTLSGVLPVSLTAWLSSRSRMVVRAAAAAVVEAARFIRHGAPCSRSAAMPPMCGDAADVPKNVDGNAPAPVIDTPSIAVMSGFWRPSSVGPRLLRTSAVRFGVSGHDWLGTAAGEFPAAFADAEQIAPTERTLAGEPPASLCAPTLRVAVLKLWRS